MKLADHGSAQVPGWLAALAAGGRACHLPSGQLPPPWAWRENEAPATRTARSPSQVACSRLALSGRGVRRRRRCWRATLHQGDADQDDAGPDEQVRGCWLAEEDDAQHHGHDRQQIGDGRGRGWAFVGDEPVVQDIGRAGAQGAEDADGRQDTRGELVQAAANLPPQRPAEPPSGTLVARTRRAKPESPGRRAAHGR